MVPLSVSLRSTCLNERMRLHPAALTWWLCNYHSLGAAADSTGRRSTSSASWILPRCTVEAREFQDLAQSAGIRRIAFLRHGNTAPAEDGVDFNRVLTALGREQARQAGRSFGATALLPFAMVLVSPAPRTVETAQLFLEEVALAVKSSDSASDSVPSSSSSSKHASSTEELSLVQGLYDGTMQPEGSVLFRKIGYAPLSSYVDADDGADREVARRVLGEYSTLVAHEVLQCLRQLSVDSTQRNSAPKSSDTGSTFLVVGHAIYLPAAALGVSTLCGSSNQQLLLDTNTQEAQGYCIDLALSRVELLESIKSP